VREESTQLWMRLILTDKPPAPDVPNGYSLRTHQPGDDGAWIKLLNTGFDPWDQDRLDRMLTRPNPRLPLEAIFFITHAEGIVGSACLFLDNGGDELVGELGWVVVNPAHQGRALGKAACLAALRYAWQHRLPSVYLRTEEARLPAIRLYLTLGFAPKMRADTHPERWRVLLNRLQG
jgi:mycothiol synthase